MKKWRCTVCGYIHEGEQPPEKCPVCGATKDKFVLLDEIAGEKQGSTSGTATNADIIVVGSGAAAFSAAVTARSKGASVIMLEKAEQLGGTTARSGGGYWIPNNRYQKQAGYIDNRDDCVRYMARYSYPHLYDPDAKHYGLPKRQIRLMQAHYDNGSKMVDYFEEIGALHSTLEINWTGKPQVDYQNELPENKNIRGRSLYSKNPDGGLGPGYDLIRQLQQWAADNQITMLTNCEVTSLTRAASGRVTGVNATHNGEAVAFTANKGVIFGSGGYSHNPEYMLQFQRGPHYGGCSVPTNTGDFIRIAGEIGARIGNTAGAFRAQSMIEMALKAPGGSSNVFYLIGDSMILVDKHGKRIVNEKRNYTDRAMSHFAWNAQKAQWDNLLSFMLFDERTATLWQGFPPLPVKTDPQPDYLIKSDSLEQLEAQLYKRLQGIADKTGGFALDDDFLVNLKQTIAKFNDYAKTGKDLDFGRGEPLYDREWTTFPPTIPGVQWPDKNSKNYTMHPFSSEGPYYAIILAAGTLDTNGGPVINTNAQVLDWNDQVIDGLYGAGNCIASPAANAYWGGGCTIGLGLTFGYIAANHALGE